MKVVIEYEKVGSRIREIRIKKGFTQEVLAEMVDIVPSFLSDIEHGKTKMSTETLVKIAKSLHTSTDFLLFGEISLENDQYTNIAIAEIKEILKDKEKSQVNAFVGLCKHLTEFLATINW